MDKHLHIITHTVPWPADFGGVIDLFYKIRELHSQGIHIHLHCFTEKGRQEPALEKWCYEVQYYPRKSLASISLRLPYIVSSRKSRLLADNLGRDNYPVLLEGIHCSYLLHTGELKDRKVLLRLHNVEHIYYRQLMKWEGNLFRKIYYLIESSLLKKYERGIASKAVVLAVSQADKEFYERTFKAYRVHFLPVFLKNDLISGEPGKGFYCLYHGNLAINENEKAASWLFHEVFRDLDVPFVIAGRNASRKLQEMGKDSPHFCMVSNPTDQELHDLIRKAHINILPSFNETGIKLKLLNALFNGRHCLVNENAARGSAVENECHIAYTAGEFRKEVKSLLSKEFSEEDRSHRKTVLSKVYNNRENALRLIALIY